jgi:sec-independent protein translocase protein TatC
MKEMSFMQHLEDLRKAAIRILIIVFVSFFLAYANGEVISNFLLEPLRLAMKDTTGRIVQLGVLDKVLAQFQVAFWSSLLLSSPLWFREIWSFIKPGLYPEEVKVIRPFIFIGFLLFATGVAFGYYLVFPATFETLLNFGVQEVDQMMGIKEYLVLSCKVLLFLGIIFQLPNAMLILGYMGLVTKQSLRSWRRYTCVGFAVLSAALTPPDIVTMMGLWIPLVLLYELGIWGVALFVHPFLEKRHT